MSRFGQAVATNSTTENEGFGNSVVSGGEQVMVVPLGSGDGSWEGECPSRFAKFLCGRVFIAYYC